MVRRVFFQVNRNVDKGFMPVAQAADRIPGRPDGRTAFFDAARRALDYLMEELESHPKDSIAPIGQLMLMTDGIDNESGPHSQPNLARMIGLLLKEYCPGGDLTKSGLMIVYWAFGDGTPRDRARHAEIAKSLQIPDCWFRYSKGEGEQVRDAARVLSRSMHDAGTVGETRLF